MQEKEKGLSQWSLKSWMALGLAERAGRVSSEEGKHEAVGQLWTWHMMAEELCARF